MASGGNCDTCSAENPAIASGGKLSICSEFSSSSASELKFSTSSAVVTIGVASAVGVS